MVSTCRFKGGFVSAFLIILFIQACTFHHGSESVCIEYQGIPLALPTAGADHTVFETPATIIAIQGSGHGDPYCGKFRRLDKGAANAEGSELCQSGARLLKWVEVGLYGRP